MEATKLFVPEAFDPYRRGDPGPRAPTGCPAPGTPAKSRPRRADDADAQRYRSPSS